MDIFGGFQRLDLYCWYPEKQVGKKILCEGHGKFGD